MSSAEQLAQLDAEMENFRNGITGVKVSDDFSPLEQSYKAISETGTIQKQRFDEEIQSKFKRKCKNVFLYSPYCKIGETPKCKTVWRRGSHR